jgi:hypothetical protein
METGDQSLGQELLPEFASKWKALQASAADKQRFLQATNDLSEEQHAAVALVLRPTKRMPQKGERGPPRYSDAIKYRCWASRFAFSSSDQAVMALQTQDNVEDEFVQVTPAHEAVDRFFVEITEAVVFPYFLQVIHHLKRLQVKLHLQLDVVKISRTGGGEFFLGAVISFALPQDLEVDDEEKGEEKDESEIVLIPCCTVSNPSLMPKHSCKLTKQLSARSFNKWWML